MEQPGCNASFQDLTSCPGSEARFALKAPAASAFYTPTWRLVGSSTWGYNKSPNMGYRSRYPHYNPIHNYPCTLQVSLPHRNRREVETEDLPGCRLSAEVARVAFCKTAAELSSPPKPLTLNP